MWPPFDTKDIYMLTSKPRLVCTAVLSLLSSMAWAVDFGPFTLTGFAKYEFSRSSNQCIDCQLYANEDRQRSWADAIAPGKTYGARDGSTSLFQPYIGTQQFDIGKGFKISGLLSQRWRDGRIDIPGVYYERNAKIEHEDYGTVQVGAFPTRAWSVADYPYGTKVGVADAWGASGSGYGLLTHAIRYTSRQYDVYGGDLRLEYTYDGGDTGFTRLKPSFHEVYAQYVKGDLVLDVMAQDATNGLPSAWTHGPFRGIVNQASDEATAVANGMQSNHQKLLMAMARYQYNSKTELSGGIRKNYWSGAKAVTLGTTSSGDYIWNNMFNYNWTSGNAHAADSIDILLGMRYRLDAKWTLSSGLVYLGKANTDNPVERGQSNSMMLNTIGLGYEVEPGFTIYGFGGMVHYKNLGLAPLSMPSHTSFSGVDSRVSTSGNWLGVGAVYTF